MMQTNFFIMIYFLTSFIFAQANEPISPLAMPKNIDKEKTSLGKMLFFEPRLSKSGVISCNSCHNLATGGVDNLKSSIGHKWNIGPINSPTVFNSSNNFVQFWDGRAKNLFEQAGGPIANPGEMASTHALAVETLNSISGYKKLFKKVFKKDVITIELVQEAIASFEETLITEDSKFDLWLKGNKSALATNELDGYQLFKNKGCVGCHSGINVGGSMFQKFGLVKPYSKDAQTLGRFNVTKQDNDKFVFKVPTLRNIELTYPYFHDGSVWTLEEAVSTMAEHQLGISLTKDENKKIVAFLKTLTGKQPQIVLPILPPSEEKTPKPELN